MKIGIYGAGAIGGWMGAKLGHSGATISVVARNQTLAALKLHGLRLIDAQNAALPITVAVTASSNPADLGVQDLVIIAVKSQAMPDVAAAIGPMIGENTTILSAMNGVPWWFMQGFGGPYKNQPLKAVDADGVIAAAIPAKHIVGCVVHASSTSPEPGLVRHNFGNKLIFGEPSGATSARLATLVALFTEAGFETVLSQEIQKDIWFKLWGNMTVNPISAMTGATTDRIMSDDLVRNFVSAIMLEAKEIGARIGISIDQQPEDRHAVTMKLGSFKPSMLQDVEAGKSIELDALVTVVRELGQITGVATPHTDALLGLSRLHARTHGLY
jgi:2-dehydropantoate 2-reductase